MLDRFILMPEFSTETLGSSHVSHWQRHHDNFWWLFRILWSGYL